METKKNEKCKVLCNKCGAATEGNMSGEIAVVGLHANSTNGVFCPDSGCIGTKC